MFIIRKTIFDNIEHEGCSWTCTNSYFRRRHTFLEEQGRLLSKPIEFVLVSLVFSQMIVDDPRILLFETRHQLFNNHLTFLSLENKDITIFSILFGYLASEILDFWFRNIIRIISSRIARRCATLFTGVKASSSLWKSSSQFLEFLE